MLWLAERSVCMRVCKHGCGVKMFCFSRKHEFEKVFKFKTQQVYFIYPFLRRLKLGKSLQRRCVNFFSLKLTFYARKVPILESIFLQNKNWLCMQDFVDKTLRVIRISLLISAIQRVLHFFSGNLFYKNSRKLFTCVCIAWYKHLRHWENSRQLCKPSTLSQVCITVLNSPNPSRAYIRLCRHGKRFLLLKYSQFSHSDHFSWATTSCKRPLCK